MSTKNPQKAAGAVKRRTKRAKALTLNTGVAISNEGPEYVPHDVPAYYDHDGLLSVLNLAIIEDMATLIIGETGTGKTSAVRFMAEQYGAPFRRINLNGGTSADELVGRILLNKEGTYWVDGVLTDAMRAGHWLVLDEINAAGADVLFLLHSLLDDDRMIVLTEHGGEVVKPHAAFRVFATANPSGDYAGTREMSKALLSRFPFVLNASFPNEAKEIEILAERAQTFDTSLARSLIKIANSSREAHSKGSMDLVFSTRDVLNVARIAECMGGDAEALKSAIKVSMAGKCSKEDAASIADFARLHIVAAAPASPTTSSAKPKT